jgi:hypothetical protein
LGELITNHTARRGTCLLAEGWAVAALALCAPASAAPRPVIRVGGPSAPADSKVAIVASSRRLAGRRFEVVGARGGRVLSGRLRPAAGSPAPWRFAARADLSAISRPGAYRVRVGGLRSPPWVVSRHPSGAPIARLLRMFAVNSDGTERSPVFGPAHLNDAVVLGGPYDGQRFDLTGGWRDAGDFIKITVSTAYAVTLLQFAARLDGPDAAALRATSQVGVRWLLKAHPAPDLFVAQVGDERDHALGFRDPAKDDSLSTPGIGQRLAYPSTGANAAGLAASALALAADAAGDDERARLLGAAREWYAAGRAAAGAIPSTLLYSSADWKDHLALGAAVLFRSTGERPYLDDALAYLKASPLDAGVTPYDLAPLAAAELCGGLGAPAVSDPDARRAGCGALADAARAARERARTTAFGSPGAFVFGWVQDNGGSGTIALAAARSHVLGGGQAVAAAARDYMLGANPWGTSFVVGQGPRAAHNPHHSAFLFGSPARLLDGAVVGGPASLASLRESGLRLARGRLSAFNSPLAAYEDRRDDFVTSEVGLSYSSSAILLLAALAR